MEFALPLFALLLTPGPTNTLIALAGAERGWRGALQLTPYEIAAYMLMTIPLAILGSRLPADQSMLRHAITLLAAVWVGYLAIRLWRLPAPDAEAGNGSGALRLFTTTLCNPKGLIIGLVLLPSQPHLGWAAATFAMILLIVSAFWAVIGHVAGGGMGLKPIVRRASATWLGILAIWLAAAGIAA
jgi:threonine/homoserine/homoserine lactone efflux protein